MATTRNALGPFTAAPKLNFYRLTPADYIEKHDIQHLVAAAVVMHEGRVLLVQRSAHEYMALKWEVPGGSCDSDDESILHAACRELWEESGLRVTAVLDVVENADDAVKWYEWHEGEVIWRKFTFLVEVEQREQVTEGTWRENGIKLALSPPGVKLDPNEHTDYVWATEKEVSANRCGEKMLDWTSVEQKNTILSAFKLVSPTKPSV